MPMNALPGDEFRFPERKPCSEPVSPAFVLNRLVQRLQMHVVLPANADTAIALWILATHFALPTDNPDDDSDNLRPRKRPAIHTAPLLGITSDVKRCGKTTLRELLERLVARPLATTHTTPQALFRIIHAHTPTVLFDEADTFLMPRRAHELRGILNAGHIWGASVVRVVAGQARTFSTWGFKAIAGIGKLPDTVADRSIRIHMKRKLVSEMREPVPENLNALRGMCERIADDYAGVLRDAVPTLPPELNDRDRDNWGTLLAIADLGGDEWSARARVAAVALCQRPAAADDKSLVLLESIRRAFEESGAVRLATESLIGWLKQDPAKPLAGCHGSVEQMIASTLSNFEISPRVMRHRK